MYHGKLHTRWNLGRYPGPNTVKKYSNTGLKEASIYSSSFRWWDYVLDTEYTPDALKRRRENKAKASKAQ
jgi:hypothetical protein